MKGFPLLKSKLGLAKCGYFRRGITSGDSTALDKCLTLVSDLAPVTSAAAAGAAAALGVTALVGVDVRG